MCVCTADAFLKQGAQHNFGLPVLWSSGVVRFTPLRRGKLAVACVFFLSLGGLRGLGLLRMGRVPLQHEACPFLRVCHCVQLPNTQTDLRSFRRPVSRRYTTAIRLLRWSSYDLFEIDIFVSSKCILDIITLVLCLRDSALVCSVAVCDPSAPFRRVFRVSKRQPLKASCPD